MAKKNQKDLKSPVVSPLGKIPWNIVLAGSVIAAMFGVYYSVIRSPFIQDDWYILRSILTKGSAGFLIETLRPWGGFFYRPVGELYLLLLYQFFHLNPVGYHLVAILLHGADVLLIILIIHRISGDTMTAWLSGIFYGAAVMYHRDPLYWIVGAFDLLGILFFLLSYYLFLARRPLSSAAATLVAVFTKEATVVLPFILVMHRFITGPDEGESFLLRMRKASADLRYHFAALGLYAIAGVRNILFARDVGTGGVYEYKLWGSHIFENLGNYFQWFYEQISFPLNEFDATAWLVVAVPVIVFVAVIIARRKTIFSPARKIFLCWAVLGLLPVLPLVNHSYRYYMLYSLPAMYAFIFSLLSDSGRKFTRTSRVVAISLMVIACAFGMRYIVRLDPKHFDVPHIEGSNNLTWKGTLVDVLREHLRTHYHTLPRNAVFIFDWVPTVAFGREIAPDIWYGDSTISVYEIDEIGTDPRGIFVTDPLTKIDPKLPVPPDLRKRYLDTTRTILFNFRSGVLTSNWIGAH